MHLVHPVGVVGDVDRGFPAEVACTDVYRIERELDTLARHFTEIARCRGESRLLRDRACRDEVLAVAAVDFERESDAVFEGREIEGCIPRVGGLPAQVLVGRRGYENGIFEAASDVPGGPCSENVGGR